jgi:GT2 family glycosyltransferase
MKKIAILITCHNRRLKTLACLGSFLQADAASKFDSEIWLVDDGSTDGTDLAVQALYPQVIIIKGDGNLFWNGGMHLAFEAALKKGYDYYMWLNDDTLLYPSSLQRLIEVSTQLKLDQGRGVIIVGATQDEFTGEISYGGVVRPSKWKPTSFKLMPSRAEAVRCDTMNGNCVLIPNEIAQKLGGMEPAFAHAMGDLDYGLRAGYAGFEVWVMPGFVGTCSNNPATGSFNDAALPVSVRLRKMLQPKGLPLRSWRVFTQRHAGVFWPVYWLWPYINLIVKGMFGR